MGGKQVTLQAGEFEFRKQASLSDVLDTLAQGKAVLYRLTIPEGLTSQQVVARLKADENLTGEVTEIPPEGSLLPDTYRFSRGMARSDILERMQSDQRRFIAAIWDKRQPDLPFQTIEQALILASIVEKETGRADERERVAAVFVNRMRRKMRLQSDPTIVYGIAGGQGTLGRPITRSRHRHADTLQYLSNRRIAADADRQSGARHHPGNPQPGEDAGSLFRRRRYRRPHLLDDAARAQRGRAGLAQGRAGNPRAASGGGHRSASANNERRSRSTSGDDRTRWLVGLSIGPVGHPSRPCGSAATAQTEALNSRHRDASSRHLFACPLRDGGDVTNSIRYCHSPISHRVQIATRKRPAQRIRAGLRSTAAAQHDDRAKRESAYVCSFRSDAA